MGGELIVWALILISLTIVNIVLVLLRLDRDAEIRELRREVQVDRAAMEQMREDMAKTYDADLLDDLQRRFRPKGVTMP